MTRQTAWDHAAYFLYAWLGGAAYAWLYEVMRQRRNLRVDRTFADLLTWSLIAHLTQKNRVWQ